MLPKKGDRVLIRIGHSIAYDIESDEALRSLHIAGTVSFATDRNTRLDVGLIRIESSEDATEEGFDCDAHRAAIEPDAPKAALIVGSPNQPVDARYRALIRLVYFDGMDKESCPAIVCCGGRLDLHGAPMNRTWVKLGSDAMEGDTEITLAEAVEGWRPGHRVMAVSTERLFLIRYIGRDGQDEVIPTVRTNTHTEERVVKAVSGTKVVLDRPLEFDHRGEGEYRGEIADLSRNVIIESADPDGVRGHVMYHKGSSGSISYAEFARLGKKGVLGRYSLHFHMCRDTMRGSSVIGASFHDSDNRWLTLHGTDYMVVRDCVGYNSIGHGFFLEDGTEVFNVLDRNLAVQARHGAPLPKQNLPFDDNSGAGYWWANSLNTFTRNVAAECDQYGFRFEATKTEDFDPTLMVPQPDGTLRPVDVRTLPFVRFDDNEVHTLRRFALNLGGIRHVSDEEDNHQVDTRGDLSKVIGGDVQGVGPDHRHPFMIRNFKVWSSHWVFHGGSPCVRIDGLDAYSCTYGIFKTRTENHEYRNMRMRKIDTADIFQPWASSNLKANYFQFLDPVDDLPPTSVITHVQRLPNGKVLIRGTAADNGSISSIRIDKEEAIPLREDFAEWEATIELSSIRDGSVTSIAQDAEGNIEPRPHRFSVPPCIEATGILPR